MIHHYTDGTHDQTGTYRSVPGAGKHPSARWLALHGWHDVADRPDPPAPTGYEWQAAEPSHALVDRVSTPQGQWVAVETAAVEAAQQEAKSAELKAAENQLCAILAKHGAKPGMAADELVAILLAMTTAKGLSAVADAVGALVWLRAVEGRGGSIDTVTYHPEIRQ